jgi:hypothetical protein
MRDTFKSPLNRTILELKLIYVIQHKAKTLNRTILRKASTASRPQSHHTGIEISLQNCVRLSAGTLNRTILELK